MTHNDFVSHALTHEGAQAETTSESNSQRLRLPQLLLGLAVVAYALYFTWLTFLRFDAFEARALDLGNFDQAIWNTAHGRWFHLTNQDGIVNRLSLHVEPILIPISWLYWIASSPKTLLLLQAIVVGIGAIPVYALARYELKNSWLALLFALSFLLNPSIQAANWLEFHGLTLAPTFLLAAFYYLRTGQSGRFALFAILAASCKEEIALLVLMMGIYAFVGMAKRRLGLLTAVSALAWALTAVLGIQQFFGDGNIHWGRYDYLGESPLQIVIALITQPGLVWIQLQKASAFIYLLRHLIPVALLGLLAPEMFALALPSLGLNLLADFSPMHQIDTLIYAAPIVPFAIIAGVFGTRRLLNQWIPTAYRQTARRLVALLMLSSILVNQALYGYTPGSGNYKSLQVTEHHRLANEVIRQIPAEAKVSAQDRLNPHVSQRETVYIFPRVDDADTVFLDVTGPPWPLHPNDIRQQVDELRANGFGIAAAQDGYLLLSQLSTNQSMPESFYSAWHVSDPNVMASMDPIDVDFGGLFKLIGIRVEADRNGELVTRLFWQILAEEPRDINFYVAYLDQAGQPLHSTQFYPLPVTLWYPTSLWTVGNTAAAEDVRTYVVQTLPWALESEPFTLAVGLFWSDTDADWSSAERLVVTRGADRYPLLEGKSLLRLGAYGRNRSEEWVAQPLIADAPTVALDAQLEDVITLAGITFGDSTLQAGGRLEVMLHWQTDEPVARDYSLFFHLVNDAGDVVAQVDRQPADQAGYLPMSAWVPQTMIIDPVTLELPSALPAGQYRMIAGLYFWQDGQRLPVRGANATADNGVDLGLIVVE